MAAPEYITRETLAAAFGAPEIERLEGAGLNTATVCADVNAAAAAALRHQVALDRVSLDDIAAIRGHLHNLARYWMHGEIGDDSAITVKAKQALALLKEIKEGTHKIFPTDDPATPDDEAAATGIWSEPGTALPASEWRFI